MKYLKKFEQQQQFNLFKDSEEFILPNVTYIMGTNKVLFHSTHQAPEPEFMLRAKYNATPDNLIAFTGASNVKSLKVNGTPIKIEPIKNENTTFDVLGENISIDLETGVATFPESYVIKSPVSSWSFKAKDPNYVINENTYACLLGMMDGMTIAEPMPIAEIMGYAFTTNDGVTLEVLDTFLAEMNIMIQSGMQIGFTLMDVDMNSGTFVFIDTEHQTNTTTGGLSTYSFNSEGLYDVEIELADPDMKGMQFAGTPLISIEIGNGITYIGEYTFEDCRDLTSVIIRAGEISNYAFYGCTGLTDITIGSSVTEIGDYAFSYCSSLTSITIPDSVTTIGDNAFYGCTGLTELTIGSGVTSIGDRAFQNCSGLTSITSYAQTAPIISNNTFGGVNKYGTLYYPDGSDYSNWLSILNTYFWNMMITAQYNVTSSSNYLALARTSEISHLYVNGTEVTNFGSTYSFTTKGSYTIGIILKDNTGNIQKMFKNVKALNSVIIHNSVTSIGDETFSGCPVLTSITISDSVTTIGGNAFNGCSGLTEVHIGSGVTAIGQYAFGDCSGLTSIVIPDSVTEIGQYAFYGCTGLTDVTIGSGVTSIGMYAFNRCSGLTGELVIPDSVTYIGAGAFSGCSGLTEITIGSGVTEIYYNTFENCSSLTSIVVSAGNTKYDSRENCNCLITTATNKLVFGCKNSFIPNDVTEIGYHAFYNCSGLTSINMPDSVTYIGDSAFYGCSGLTGELVIPDSVTYIGQYAFNRCSGLTGELVIPDSVTYISAGAFSGCSGLTEITIGSGVTTIGAGAFSGCTSLTSIVVSAGNTKYDSRENCNCLIETVTNRLIKGSNNSYIPDSVTSIGSEAFYGCSGLTSIVIPDSVTYIGDSAFYGCSGLTGELVIPDSVTSIDNYAFYRCKGLTSVIIGSGVTSIGMYAFNSCIGLTGELVIPDSVTKLGNRAFYDCSGLSSITIGSGVTSIGHYTFYYCSGLTSIVIPDSVTSIGENVFSYCTELTEVTIGSGVTTIDDYAFANCSGLTSITCLAPTVPSIQNTTFIHIKNGGVLKVPAGSDYSSWMKTSNYYLGKYNWTIKYI